MPSWSFKSAEAATKTVATIMIKHLDTRRIRVTQLLSPALLFRTKKGEMRNCDSVEVLHLDAVKVTRVKTRCLL